EGLKLLAQRGSADDLAAFLKTKSGVKAVYVLAAPVSTVLLPIINGQAGSSVSQQISVTSGDRLAIATMYGFSNDWFFSSADTGVDATQKGDISGSIKLLMMVLLLTSFPGPELRNSTWLVHRLQKANRLWKSQILIHLQPCPVLQKLFG
ncbi:MAG: spondin domain-containing protein, partial [Dyadobacter sp.]